MSGIGGIFDGLQKAKDRRYAQALEKSQDTEKKREFDTQETDYTNAQTASAKQKSDALAQKERDFQTKLTTVSPVDRARIQQMHDRGQLDLATEELDRVRGGYISGAQTTHENAETGLVGAQTKGVDARTALTQAQTVVERLKPAEKKAQLDLAYAALNQKGELARLSMNQKTQLATMVAGMRLQGISMEDATHEAIAQFSQDSADQRAELSASTREDTAGLSAGNPSQGVYNPWPNQRFGAPSTSGQMTPQQIDAMTRQYDGRNAAPPAPPKVGQLKPPRPGTQPVAAKPPVPPAPGNGDPKIAQYTQQLAGAHLTPPQMANALKFNVAKGNITQAEANAIQAAITAGQSGRLPSSSPPPFPTLSPR